MAKEIKLIQENKGKEPEITLLRRINSDELELENASLKIEDFDYYSIIENHFNNSIVICWDEGNKMTEGACYIAKVKK